MRATAGAEQITAARAGVETRKTQGLGAARPRGTCRNEQGPAVVVSVNLSSASHKEDLNLPRQERRGKTPRPNNAVDRPH